MVFKKEMKTLDDIRMAYNNKEYENKDPFPNVKIFKADYIFDENQSVLWNRYKVVEENEKSMKIKKEWQKKHMELQVKLEEDIIDAICNEYSGINKEQAKIIYRYVYGEYHSHFSDVFSYIHEIIELIAKFNAVR